MRKLFLLFSLFFICSIILIGQQPIYLKIPFTFIGSVYNSMTKEPIRESEGVTAIVSYTIHHLVYDNTQEPTIFSGTRICFHNEVIKTSQQFIIKEGKLNITLFDILDFTIEISGNGYESTSIHTKCNVYEPLLGSNFYIASPYSPEYVAREEFKKNMVNTNTNYTFYLVPKKTVLEGTININNITQQDPQANKPADLGVFSAKEISQRLRVSEEAILKLITNGELKAKKIGEQYFIRKEDFDEFIKK
jgi:excisionase family DNA binding protein